MIASPLVGRRIHIAGSASRATESALIRYAHAVISELTRAILAAGGGLVLGAGKEPRLDTLDSDSPSLIFDWTALKTAAWCLRHGLSKWPASSAPIVAVLSEKAESEIPSDRQEIWRELISRRYVHVEVIMPGARSGALIRQRQAEFGSALLILGGGTGVEHLADLYMARQKPVIPLDLPLGASREDGTGGSARLASEARANPPQFFPSAQTSTPLGTMLATLSTRRGIPPAEELAAQVMVLLENLAPPHIFCVRLLNKSFPSFRRVASFFRGVVDPVVEQFGFRRREVATDKASHAFLNTAIFEELHFASAAIVDVTNHRPNCFIELGYALALGIPVLVTAEEGTELPFDQQAIPCHFWKNGIRNTSRKKSFIRFWEQNFDRPPVVGTGIWKY